MPRNGGGIYSLPVEYEAETGQTIEAEQHNSPLEDIAADLNAARPVSAGGTGATTAANARATLSLYSQSQSDSFYVKRAASKNALKALDTTIFKVAFLETLGTLYSWTSGDFTDETAGDPTQVTYIPADGVAVSLGCWVAVTGAGTSVIPASAENYIVATYAAFLLISTVPDYVKRITILGYVEPNDDGGQEWIAADSEPSHAYKRQIGSTWFELHGRKGVRRLRAVTPMMFGDETHVGYMAAAAAAVALGFGLEHGNVTLGAQTVVNFAAGRFDAFQYAGTKVSVAEGTNVTPLLVLTGGALDTTGALSDRWCSGNGRQFIAQTMNATVDADYGAGTTYELALSTTAGLTTAHKLYIRSQKLVDAEHRSYVNYGGFHDIEAVDHDAGAVRLTKRLPYAVRAFNDALTVVSTTGSTITVAEALDAAKHRNCKVIYNSGDNDFAYAVEVDEATKTLTLVASDGYGPVLENLPAPAATIHIYDETYVCWATVAPFSYERLDLQSLGNDQTPRAVSINFVSDPRLIECKVDDASRWGFNVTYSTKGVATNTEVDDANLSGLGYHMLVSVGNGMRVRGSRTGNSRRGGVDCGGPVQCHDVTVEDCEIVGSAFTSLGLDWDTEAGPQNGLGNHGQACGWVYRNCTVRNVDMVIGDRGMNNLYQDIVAFGNPSTVVGAGGGGITVRGVTVIPDVEQPANDLVEAALVRIGRNVRDTVAISGIDAQRWRGNGVSIVTNTMSKARQKWSVTGNRVEFAGDNTMLAIAADGRELVHALWITKHPTEAVVYVSATGYAIAEGFTGIFAYNTTSPTSPLLTKKVLGDIPMSEMVDTRESVVVGDDLWVASATSDGLSRLDLSDDPLLPRFVAEHLFAGALNGANGVTDLGSDVLAVSCYTGNKVVYVNIADPDAPFVITSFTVDSAWTSKVVGDALYVASRDADILTIFDITDPTAPTLAGTFAGPVPGTSVNSPRSLATHGDALYAACAAGAGIAVIDVTDEFDPQWVRLEQGDVPGTSLVAVTHLEVDADTDILYCAVQGASTGNTGSVASFDVSDELDPTWIEEEIGSSNRTRDCVHVRKIATGYVWACAKSLISFVDVDPGMTIVGTNTTTGPPVIDGPGIDLSGNQLSLAYGSAGPLIGFERLTVANSQARLAERRWRVGIPDDGYQKILWPVDQPVRVRVWQKPASIALDAAVSLNTTGSFAAGFDAATSGWEMRAPPFTGTSGTDGNMVIGHDGTHLWVENRSSAAVELFVEIGEPNVPIKNVQSLNVGKVLTANTASFLFRTGTVGHAEAGLIASDDYTFKASTDGSSWTTAYTVTQSGQMLFGSYATALSTKTVTTASTPALQHHSTSLGLMFLTRWSTSSSGPTLFFGKSQNATIGSHTTVTTGRELGAIKFGGSDGTEFQDGAHIVATVTSSPANSRIPTRIDFETTDGSAAVALRMSVLAGGGIGIGASAIETIRNSRHFVPRQYANTALPTAASGDQIASSDIVAAPLVSDGSRWLSPGVKVSTFTANGTISVPAGWAIVDIAFANTTANAVTGGIKIGTTSGATDVVAAQAVGGNALGFVAPADLLKRIFSTSAAQTLFIQAVTGWNSASVDISFKLEKRF